MPTTDPLSREELDHEAEALACLADVEAYENDAHSFRFDDEEGRAVHALSHAGLAAQKASLHATLALVQAQREANEQARVANRIALAQPVKIPSGGEIRHDIYKIKYGDIGDVVSVELDPEIARALNIGGDDE